MRDDRSETFVRASAGARPIPFAGAWGAILFLAVCSMLAALLSSARGQEAGGPRSALVIEVQGAIGPATTEYLRQAFEAAESDTELIVLRMDTPGGLASSMRDIIRDILASPVPVATYVSPSGARAASAGTYILYASHLAAMAPGTNLGAATPVRLGGGAPPSGEADGEDGEQDPSMRKAVNDAVAYIRGLAGLQGRNADWAEKAVREAASLPADAALQQDVVEIVAADLDDLLAQAHGRSVRLRGDAVTLETQGLRIVSLEPDWRVRLLGAISNPNIAYILMLIGIYGIIFELVSPGAIFPGVIGAIALAVGLFALNLLPISYAGAGLVLLGIALMAAEAFTPSFGLLGIGGAIAFALGSLFMFDEAPGFELSLSVVLTATGLSVALLAVVLTAAVRAHRRKIVSGEPAFVGAAGAVLAWAGNAGRVQVHGEQWQARSAEPLRPGQRVRVTGRDGLTLTVEADTPSDS